MNRHLSAEEITGWMIGERSAEAERHAVECALCRAEIHRLEGALTDFRETGVRWSDRCYAEVYGTGGDSHSASAKSGGWRFRGLVPLWTGALAAVLCAVLLLRPAPRPGQAALADRRGEAPFLEIPYVAPLAPYERITVARMDIPVAALIRAGFEVHIADVASSVRADVVFGQDGRAHAIRLVSDGMTDSWRIDE